MEAWYHPPLHECPPTGGSHGKLHRTTKVLSHARRCGSGVARWGARAAGGDAIVVDGVPDPELIQKQVLPKLLLLRRRAIFCELPLTRGGCRDFRRGDGSERAVGRHDTHQTDFAFLPV